MSSRNESGDEVSNRIHVVGAAILRERTCLAAQRSATMSEPLCWEFPGGKVEPNESPREALIREIREELDCAIQLGPLLGSTQLNRGGREIRLDVYEAQLASGRPRPLEHRQIKWVDAAGFAALPFAPADAPLVPPVIARLARAPGPDRPLDETRARHRSDHRT